MQTKKDFHTVIIHPRRISNGSGYFGSKPLSLSFGIHFRCITRRRRLTVDRAPLLYDESSLTLAAVTRNNSWSDFANIARKKASRLALLRANITLTIYIVSDVVLIERSNTTRLMSLTVTADSKNLTLAETVTFLSEGSILTLTFGMIQVNYAFPQDLTAKISPHNVNSSKVEKYRL